MYLSVTEAKHTFHKPQPSKLISMIPLCAKTIILFCQDHSFYHYSLLQSKLLYQSKLPGRPIRTVSISDHQILCTIAEKRLLILLNIRDKELTEICSLPQSNVYNEGKQKQIFTQINVFCFEDTNSFYIEEPRSEQNKTRIAFLPKQLIGSKVSKKDFISRDFDSKQQRIKKVDSRSSIVIFKQTPQQNAVFRFKTFNCAANFEQRSYIVENKAFTLSSVVRQVNKISHQMGDEKYLIFVNGNPSQILIFNEIECRQYNYKPNKVFLMTVLINVKVGYGMFLFMPDPIDKDPEQENVLQLVNLQNGSIINSHKCTVNDIVKSWEDDYFIYFKAQTKETANTQFITSHVLGKKYLYMKMLQESQLTRQTSPNFKQQISNML